MEEKEIFKLEGEIWRDVVGYEGLYEVSNYGRVASLNYMHTGKWHLLSQAKDKKGYQQVRLFKDGKEDPQSVHTLVGMAFQDICGTYFEGAEIDHINGIKDDNRAINLRWCTHKENSNNPITIKKISKPVLQFTKDGTFIAEYPSIREAERKTGVRHSNISKCCLGKTYYKSAGGFGWKYKEVG